MASDWTWPWEPTPIDLSRAVQARLANQQHMFTRLLGGDEATLDKLNFSVEEGGQEVQFNRMEYYGIASDMADGQILQKPASQAGGAPTIAAYGMGNDTMYLGATSSHSAHDRAALIHEMTHAIIDKANANKWTAATNECAGFFAQVAFLAIKGEPTATASEKADPLCYDVLTRALAIVQKSGITAGRKATKINTYGEWPGYRDALKAYYVATGAWMDPNTAKSKDGEQNAGANGLLDPRLRKP